ncbi:hypothetical protein [Aliikangiella coralliicola]|uniref:Uncharacterized protein n=1 Tax=Aliikangiella coralliicola TaxID=2592383 RepID=A0A545UCU8_9GAMM|nr:hypothetical protein [Aliikangiella coralliicola]TQV87253.1 hypothetical protein FLL46_12425 [Aliikangiella coralliicola]
MDTQPELRQGRYQVSLIGINSRYEPPLQFGLSYPDRNNPYADIVTSWGRNSQSPRQQEEQVNVPLAKRTQTFLSYQVSPELAEQLRGFRLQGNTGRQQGSTSHRITISTHRTTHSAYNHKAAHMPRLQPNIREQQRESIVTSFGSPGDPVNRRMMVAGR